MLVVSARWLGRSGNDMIRRPWQQRWLAPFFLVVVFQGSASTQGQRVDILLPGDEYHRKDLPPDASGTWWVLHRPEGQTVLELMESVVTPFRACGDEDLSPPTGRAVQVPAARGPILLLRGLPGLRPGLIRTAFVDTSGAGQSVRIEAPWDESTVVVQRVADGPYGDQPGQYRVELLFGTGAVSVACG